MVTEGQEGRSRAAAGGAPLPEGLECEQEGQPRALLSSPPLPSLSCSAEQAFKGRGTPQVIDYDDDTLEANTSSPLMYSQQQWLK